jgi:hypothetical protein
MARARNIKPGFFKNEYLAECEHGARLLFAGLWCLADREGRLEDRPMRIKADLFPYEAVTIEKWLAELQKRGFLVRYEVKGCKYIQILNFKKHQNPHIHEQKSTIPAPEKHHASPASSLIPDSPILIPEECTEPAAPVPFITFTLNDKTEFPIFETQIAEWETLFPRVDVRQELREMRAWGLANPTKRKTSRGVLKFVTSWLSREQDRGGTNGQANHAPKLNAFDRTKQRLADWERTNGGTVIDGQALVAND